MSNIMANPITLAYNNSIYRNYTNYQDKLKAGTQRNFG